MRKSGKRSSPSRNGDNGSFDVEKALEDGGAVDRAAKQAVRQAVRRHKLLGESIVVWRKGKVVWLKPEEI